MLHTQLCVACLVVATYACGSGEGTRTIESDGSGGSPPMGAGGSVDPPSDADRGLGGAADAPGGSPGHGGSPAEGGSGAGGRGSGGLVSLGGATALGQGGATTPGACSREARSCSTPEVTVSEVELGSPVTGYGMQWDTDPFPMAIAAMPSGGSRLAWLGTDKHVYVATLGCEDELVGTPVSFPAEDLQDIYADDDGGVVMLTRNATNSGENNCGSGTICGGTSNQCQLGTQRSEEDDLAVGVLRRRAFRQYLKFTYATTD